MKKNSHVNETANLQWKCVMCDESYIIQEPNKARENVHTQDMQVAEVSHMMGRDNCYVIIKKKSVVIEKTK